MGKSPSIEQMQKKEEAFNAYLQNLEQQLATKSADQKQKLDDQIGQFYTSNGYTDAKDIVSGQNFDFMHQAEFSLANLKNVVDAISKAVFAGTGAPSGATVDSDGTKAAAEALGPEVGEMENLELYIAGQVFDVLSNVILSFGTSTQISFNTDVQSKPLGYGLQMFTAVSVDSYQSTSFFNNEFIYEYLYLYDVKFSVMQAQSEVKMSLVELYQDQVAVFKKREEDLLAQLEAGTLTADAYTTANAAFDTLIAAAEKKIDDLKTAAVAAGKA